MKLPLTVVPKSEQISTDAFGGYEKRNISSGISFSEMENMTGDFSPLVSTRRHRGIINTGSSIVKSIISADFRRTGDNKLIKNALFADCGQRIKSIYTDGDSLITHDEVNLPSFNESGRSYVACGAELFIFPDKIRMKLMNRGSTSYMEAISEIHLGQYNGYFYELIFSPCDIDGNAVTGVSQFCAMTEKYYSLTSSGTKGAFIDYAGVPAAFNEGDTVMISGLSPAENNKYCRIIKKDTVNRRLVLERTLSATVSVGTVTISRTVPDMDFVISAGNRLWGCRYGVDSYGNSLNEIYASALGDPTNWRSYQGISTDSWTASVGSPGAFTGAAVFNGNPVFFKEDCIIKVFGNQPSEFTLSESKVRGVESGSSGSIAVVNDIMYYKSYSGIVRYDGGIPRNVDAPLGNVRYKNAVAGADGSKYYVSMEDESGNHHLFVYDSDTRLWHREDSSHAVSFCRCGSELFMLLFDGTLIAINGTFNNDNNFPGHKEENFNWFCTTNPIGYGIQNRKYISSLSLRMEPGDNAEADIFIEYDNDSIWHSAAEIKGESDSMITVPIIPMRCDSFKLKIAGHGDMKLRSICFTSEEAI